MQYLQRRLVQDSSFCPLMASKPWVGIARVLSVICLLQSWIESKRCEIDPWLLWDTIGKSISAFQNPPKYLTLDDLEEVIPRSRKWKLRVHFNRYTSCCFGVVYYSTRTVIFCIYFVNITFRMLSNYVICALLCGDRYIEIVPNVVCWWK